MSSIYRHKQAGWVLIVSLTLVMLLETTLAILLHFYWLMLIDAPLLVLALLFGSLSVMVEETAVTVRFGPGPIRFRYLVKDIESAKAVRNGWYYGYGIRRLPSGWLYNVSGLDAVEIELKDGHVHRIGTDEPEALEKAIQRGMKRTKSER